MSPTRPRSTLFFAIRIVVLSATVILLSGSGYGATADCTSCGDANGDGMYTVADIAYLTAFLYAGGPAPAECADIDGYDLITIRDVVAGGTMASPQCVTQPKIVPQPTTKYAIEFTGLVPANLSSLTVPVVFSIGYQAPKVKAFSLPMLVRVDGQIPNSLSASVVGSGWPGGGVQVLTDSALGAILGYDLDGAAGMGNHLLFQFTIGVVPSPVIRPLTLEFTELGPTMAGVFAPPNSACVYAMVLQENLSAWLPRIDSDCKCGDADNSGYWSISDVVFIINHIFAGGPPPLMVCLADADGNGIETISDAVFLIGYIFAGAPQPGGC